MNRLSVSLAALLCFFSLGAAKTDLDRLFIKGQVRSVVYNDTSLMFSENGTLISDVGEDTSVYQYNSRRQPMLKTVSGNRTYFQYDYQGFLEKRTDCKSEDKCDVFEYEYNSDGMIVNRNNCARNGGAYVCPSFLKYSYDDNGVLSEIQLFNGTTQALMRRTAFTYDAQGNLQKESSYEKGDSRPAEVCDYTVDAGGNWISRSCTKGKKKGTMRRTIVYYVQPEANADVASPEPGDSRDDSVDSVPSAPVKTGNFPVTGGYVSGSFLWGDIPLAFTLSNSGYGGKVKSVFRRMFAETENGSRSFISADRLSFDEAGNQTEWEKLDENGTVVSQVDFGKGTEFVFPLTLTSDASAPEKAMAKIAFNENRDWTSVQVKRYSMTFKTDYDKLGRMVQRNDLRFEYNGQGKVEHVWHSDTDFDTFFFNGAGKRIKAFHYDCATGHCDVITESSLTEDNYGNIVLEKTTDASSKQSQITETVIVYYK